VNTFFVWVQVVRGEYWLMAEYGDVNDAVDLALCYRRAGVPATVIPERGAAFG